MGLENRVSRLEDEYERQQPQGCGLCAGGYEVVHLERDEPEPPEPEPCRWLGGCYYGFRRLVVRVVPGRTDPDYQPPEDRR